MRRRYEVWFLRLALADGSGAWWFRYLLMNLARGGCPGNPRGAPAQVWAIWFPRDAAPQSFIQGFALDQLSVSPPGASPLELRIGENRLGDDTCSGCLDVESHRVEWDLRYRSAFGTSLTEVGWVGFSRTPHSDAVFSGRITLDGRTFRGDPLGYGLQGHNCGFRHRHLWSWTHCFFRTADGRPCTFEALVYELPFGLRFRKALLWHGGRLRIFRELDELNRNRERPFWITQWFDPADGTCLTAMVDGRGPSAHRLPYLKTDCSGTFEVANNSLARATLCLSRAGELPETISTDDGAVVEMAGR